MNEEIIKMAKDSGIYHAFDSEGQWDGLTDEQLIERRPKHPDSVVYGDKRIVEILERFFHMAQAAEREACAKVCEDGVDTEHPTVKGHIMKNFGASEHLAAAIRARGQA